MNKIIKNSILGLSLTTVTILFAGCEATKALNKALGGVSSPQEFVQRSSDTYLANKFSKYFRAKGDIRTRGVSKDHINLYTRIIDFDEGIRQEADFDTVERRFENDILAKEYKEAILQRGNSYKVYNNQFNKMVFSHGLGVKSFKTRDRVGKYAFDWTPCILEYDNDGKIVSAMIRSQEISVAFNQFQDPIAPIQVHSQIIILTDYKARSLQNRISRKLFDENFLFSSK